MRIDTMESGDNPIPADGRRERRGAILGRVNCHRLPRCPVALPSLAVSAAAVLLAACGGSEPGASIFSDNTPLPPAPPPAVQTGVFRDGTVTGLSFVSGGESGVTDASGSFTCETGRDVTFSIGAVTIGATECATLVMPPSLSPSGTLDDPVSINIARFLQMLDRDGEPSNGLEISAAVRQIALSWMPVNFAAEDFDAEVVTIVSDAASVDGTPHALPSGEAARAHLESRVACSYAGAFYGPFTGDNRGVMGLVIGWITSLSPATFDPIFSPGEFQWLAFDAANQASFGGAGSASIRYSSRPEISDAGPGAGNEFIARFDSPDNISGRWTRPALNADGELQLGRLASGGGDYRFVGKFASFRREGMIVLDLDGSEVTGTAIDVLRGQIFTVTGSLVGDEMSLVPFDGANDRSASGTVLFDTEGAPIGVSGDWLNDGLFQAAACRLN